MAVPRLRVPPADSGSTLRQASDEVELYHRTYTTLLRSSGETMLRVLEPSHAAMNSSLHSLAHDPQAPDLGAFLYALRRLPASIWQASVVGGRQGAGGFERAGGGCAAGGGGGAWGGGGGGRRGGGAGAGPPPRRRRWYDSGRGTLAVLL